MNLDIVLPRDSHLENVLCDDGEHRSARVGAGASLVDLLRGRSIPAEVEIGGLAVHGAVQFQHERLCFRSETIDERRPTP